MTTTPTKNESLPELVARRFKRVTVSLLVGAQICVAAWIAGVSFTERTPELACTYAAAVYLSIVAYLFPAWNRNHE